MLHPPSSGNGINNEIISAIYDAPAPAVSAVSDLRAVNVPADAISLHAAVGAMLDETKIDGAEPAKQATREKSIWSSRFGCEAKLARDGRTVLTVKLAGPNASALVDILENHRPVAIDKRTTGDVPSSPA